MQTPRALADVRRLLAGIIRALLQAAILLLPPALRLTCAGEALAAAVFAAPRAWRAFGADTIALLPAAAIVLLPLATSQLAGLSWGGLLAAGALTAGIGVLAEQVDSLTRALFVVATLAAVVYHFQPTSVEDQLSHNERSIHDEQSERMPCWPIVSTGSCALQRKATNGTCRF